MRDAEPKGLMELGKLSGSDYFHLLIDRKIQKFGLAGNISRVHFQLDSSINLESFAHSLKANSRLKEASQIQYKLSWPFLPKWIRVKSQGPRIFLSKSITQNDFESQILNRKVDNELGLVCVDLCAFADNTKHVVISMHHALFDHQGMMNFIRALNGDFEGNDFPELESNGFGNSLVNFWRMTLYMLSRGSSKLGSLLTKKSSKQAAPLYDSLKL
ncbi:MAG: hypothetical protein ACPG5W_11470, partial [Flavobacteriales bacterium]